MLLPTGASNGGHGPLIVASAKVPRHALFLTGSDHAPRMVGYSQQRRSFSLEATMRRVWWDTPRSDSHGTSQTRSYSLLLTRYSSLSRARDVDRTPRKNFGKGEIGRQLHWLQA